jgi:hypothetical protein
VKVKWKSRRTRAERIGDERVRTLFAWRPLAADDGYTYWMSKLVVREKLLPKIARGGFAEDSEEWEILHAEPLSAHRKRK